MALCDWAAGEMMGMASLLATVCSNLNFCKEAEWGLGVGVLSGGLTAGRSQANPEELSELGQLGIRSLQLLGERYHLSNTYGIAGTKLSTLPAFTGEACEPVDWRVDCSESSWLGDIVCPHL